MDIFLSYARESRGLAERICRLLETEDHNVFFDHDDLLGGDEFGSRIRAEIARADVLIFLISAQSIAAGSYALTELAIATSLPDEERPTILPVRTDATPFEHLPPALATVSVLDPHGDVPAEVANAIDQLRQRRRKQRLTRMGAVAALAVAAALAIGIYARVGRTRDGSASRDIAGPVASSGSEPLRALNEAVVRQAGPDRLVTLFAVPSQNAWNVTVTLADKRVRELEYRVNGGGPFVGSGTLDILNPMTGLPLANPNFTLVGPQWDARTLEIRYTDADGQLHGPHQVPFDPVQHFVAFARQSLAIAPWVTFVRGVNGQWSANFSTVLFYRHGLADIRYSVDSDALDRRLPVRADRSVPWTTPVSLEESTLPLPAGAGFIAVQLVFADGSASAVTRFEVSR